MRALGIHVFAGGFTQGVRRECDVLGQLEIHDFGRHTVEQQLKLPFVNCSRWEDWPKHRPDFIYGNPRCGAFSLLTPDKSGKSESFGACGKQTVDIWDLCRYAVEAETPIIAWESVQQAWTVGRPLLERLRDEVFGDYRICHLFINAASFGNAQVRKRYFFVAYRGGNFNVDPPILAERPTVARDVMTDAEGYEDDLDGDYRDDAYARVTDDYKVMLRRLRQGEDLNKLAARDESLLYGDLLTDRWQCRGSDLPFGLHQIRRLHPDRPAPTLCASCHKIVHPFKDRPITVREQANIMGWDFIPRGPAPYAQISKGIVPAVGQWLAQQAKLFLADAWGEEDYSLAYDDNAGQWTGEWLRGQPREKVIDLTRYAPKGERTCDERTTT